LIALNDYLNPKTGKKIFGCAKMFDHAAKQNQSQYPWAQNIDAIGLLKVVKGRWPCLPLRQRYYFPKDEIRKNRPTFKSEEISFQNKHQQAVEIHLGTATFLAKANRERALEMAVNLYGRMRTVLAYEQIVIQKTLKCSMRVVWVYRRTQWVALFTTDLSLSVTEIIDVWRPMENRGRLQRT
jgi:hypothetical protein